ncbi:MAG: putative Ig domain-containing protein, partial [Alphaproteobacteria bacterium]|nr:putative Ig domain-containing protein [Alphaproteobacteria bacterium]
AAAPSSEATPQAAPASAPASGSQSGGGQASAGGQASGQPTSQQPSFQVSTAQTSATGAESGLVVNRGMSDVAASGGSIKFDVPMDAFAHTDANASVVLEARQADGSPLPSWLQFDPATGQFTGEPPPGAGDVQVRVTARDSQGRQAEAAFRIQLREGEGEAQGKDGKDGKDGQVGQGGEPGQGDQRKIEGELRQGKQSLTAQLKATGRGARFAQADSLVEHARRVA